MAPRPASWRRRGRAGSQNRPGPPRGTRPGEGLRRLRANHNGRRLARLDRRFVHEGARGVVLALALFLVRAVLLPLALDLAPAVPELFLVLAAAVPSFAAAVAALILVRVRGGGCNDTGGE